MTLTRRGLFATLAAALAAKQLPAAQDKPTGLLVDEEIPADFRAALECLVDQIDRDCARLAYSGTRNILHVATDGVRVYDGNDSHLISEPLHWNGSYKIEALVNANG